MPGYNQTLITAQADGAAVANTTTATSLLPPSARFVLPPNYLFIGKRLKFEARGRLSNLVTTPGTLAIAINFGTIATPIIVFAPAAMQLSATANTNATWEFEAVLTCRAIGNGTQANMMGVGRFVSRALLNAPAVGTTLGVGVALLPDTAPAVGTGFDSADVTNVVDLFATFSIANAANSITLHDYALTDMNYTP